MIHVPLWWLSFTYDDLGQPRRHGIEWRYLMGAMGNGDNICMDTMGNHDGG